MSHFLLVFTKLVKLKGVQICEGGQYPLAVSKVQDPGGGVLRGKKDWDDRRKS